MLPRLRLLLPPAILFFSKPEPAILLLAPGLFLGLGPFHLQPLLHFLLRPDACFFEEPLPFGLHLNLQFLADSTPLLLHARVQLLLHERGVLFGRTPSRIGLLLLFPLQFRDLRALVLEVPAEILFDPFLLRTKSLAFLLDLLLGLHLAGPQCLEFLFPATAQLLFRRTTLFLQLPQFLLEGLLLLRQALPFLIDVARRFRLPVPELIEPLLAERVHFLAGATLNLLHLLLLLRQQHVHLLLKARAFRVDPRLRLFFQSLPFGLQLDLCFLLHAPTDILLGFQALQFEAALALFLDALLTFLRLQAETVLLLPARTFLLQTAVRFFKLQPDFLFRLPEGLLCNTTGGFLLGFPLCIGDCLLPRCLLLAEPLFLTALEFFQLLLIGGPGLFGGSGRGRTRGGSGCCRRWT